ncbi:MAG: pseudouridine synthase [Leptospirales bacterium]|jgi:tRNA pseudouridine32 synthase/23S rRNA pseudouridine746 synthase
MSAIRLIQNTDRYLIVHKAPGIAFHAERVDSEEYARTGAPGDPGALQIIRNMEESGEIPAGPRLYPVHRLDRVTSGILVFARGRQNANLLSNEFRHGRVRKIYVALSDRSPKKKQGKIVGDMERGRGGSWILTRDQNNPAITRFFSFGVPGRRPGLRLFVLQPKTGRTHQLRVALKSLGSPVLGDGLYSRYDLARNEDRAYLHAAAIRFQLGDETVEAHDPPEPGGEFAAPEFQQALKQVGDLFALFEKPENRPDPSGGASGGRAVSSKLKPENAGSARRGSGTDPRRKPGHRKKAARSPRRRRA